MNDTPTPATAANEMTGRNTAARAKTNFANIFDLNAICRSAFLLLNSKSASLILRR
jgi:hypothetical protein